MSVWETPGIASTQYHWETEGWGLLVVNRHIVSFYCWLTKAQRLRVKRPSCDETTLWRELMYSSLFIPIKVTNHFTLAYGTLVVKHMKAKQDNVVLAEGLFK